MKTSVAVSKFSLSVTSSLSSIFTQPTLIAPEFLQKKSSSIKFAKPFTVIPILPAEALGADLEYQLLKPETLPPIVPKAPFLHPGRASIFACKDSQQLRSCFLFGFDNLKKNFFLYSFNF